MEENKRHPGGPRGRQRIGETLVEQYCLLLLPEQVERIDKLRREMGVDSRSAMVRMLIEKGLVEAYGLR